VTLAAPFLLESFTVFPDGPGAIVVLTGFWALLRTEQREDGSWIAWLLHGMALLAEGGELAEPAAFVAILSRQLEKSLS